MLFAALLPKQADAQIIDSLPYFKLPLPEFVGDLDWDNIFVVMEASKKNISALPSGVTKKIGVPPAVKKIDKPIILQRGGNCYKVGPSKNNCESCHLLWYDTNGDGKIQPKRELRCVCNDCPEPCKVRGKRVDCDNPGGKKKKRKRR